MVKSVIKEFIIILLMCIAILLILGVVFYGYIPNSAIPSKIAYETPETIKNELGQSVGGNTVEKQNIVYEITDSDLTKYKQEKNYNPGKADPFAEIGAYDAPVTNGTTQNGGGTTSNGGNTNTTAGNNTNTNNTNTATNNKTGSSLFNDTSIK